MSPEIEPTAITQFLQQTLGERLLAVYAFGSRVSGHARAESDLDLAVLLAGKADVVALWELAQDIATRIDSDVDLIDLRDASTVLQHRVVTSGTRWWARDSQADLFEAFVMSDKLALDEARAPLLADIHDEGAVHGR